MDPFGNVPLVVSTLKTVPRERRRLVVLRECVIAYVLLLAFLFGGHAFLTLMRLSETSLSIAGGVILFLIALRMVFSRPSESVFGDTDAGEPLIVPLAIPAIAGPSAMATVMLMASRDPERIGTWVGALTAAMLVTTLVLLAADRLQRALGRARRARLRALDGTGAHRGRGGNAARRHTRLRRRHALSISAARACPHRPAQRRRARARAPASAPGRRECAGNRAR